MQELSVKDERDQEYEREVVAQAIGALELDICDVLAAAEAELLKLRRKISSEHNGRRTNTFASVLGRNLARDLAWDIYDCYMFRFDQYVANEDAEDKLLNSEYAADAVRQHIVDLLQRLQAGK